MYNYQKVYVLITEKLSFSYMPRVLILKGTIKEKNIFPKWRGSHHYCKVQIDDKKWPKNSSNMQVLKKNVLPRNDKNFAIFKDKAKLYFEQIIRKRNRQTKEIEKEYKKFIS